MSSDGPPLIRPIPRRPFDLNLTSATPPESSSSACPSPDPTRLKASNAKENLQSNASGADTPSFSRSRSLLNLTSSTLLGIYMPTGFSYDREGPETPWGTGAETPARVNSDGDIQIAPQDPSLRLRQASIALASQPSPASTTTSLILRSFLLFAIGLGYGVVVTHLHNDQQLAPFQVEGIIKPSYEWTYLVFWGAAGIGFGSLLPFIDKLWEEHRQAAAVNGKVNGREPSTTDREAALHNGSGPVADWNPVVRSIGAFVGIAFAIRRLPWTSTLQVSSTLALVNPVLWYLVDRSKTGFLLSMTVGVLGAGVLLGLNPEIIPSPAMYGANEAHNFTSDAVPAGINIFGTWLSQEAIACAVWVMSVLFCSCVCFGNVGRRLALRAR